MTFWQSTPNILTFSRMLLTLFFLVVLFLPFKGSNIVALIIFLLASLTDYFDGKLARLRNITSELGKFLDPFADKILIIGAFIAFVELKLIPGWMVIVILTREFLITGLRLVAVSFKKSIPATRIAKHKTLSQILAIYLILIFLCLKDYGLSQYQMIQFQIFILGFMYLTIFLTIVSGIAYLNNNRYVFTPHHRKPNR